MRTDRFNLARLAGPWAIAGSVLVSIVAAPRHAHAFCRTTTVKATNDYNPGATGQCWSEGLPVYWGNACVSYDLQESASPSVSYSAASTALSTAFGLWTGTSCGSGSASIKVSDLGKVSCGLVEYNECGPNQHVIVFRETWPYDDAANALALTTVTFNLDTGELYDADMEINASVPLSLATPVPPGAYDFATIVTHETGHFLGMAHAISSTATMYAFLNPGETRRTLSADDSEGLCTIYPADGTRAVVTDAGPGFVDAAACDPTPRHGFTTACMPTPVDGGTACEPPPSSGGCAAGGREPGPSWMPILLAFGLYRRRGRGVTRAT